MIHHSQRPRKLGPEERMGKFSCGVPFIDKWAAQRAPSSTRHGTAVAYASFTASGEPAGFYTLSAYSVLRARSVSGALGSRALIVEPYDNKARAFYAHFGFQPIPGTTSMCLRLV